MALPHALKSRARIEMRPSARGVQDILMLGRYNNTVAGPGLAEHAHGAALEICFLVTGFQTYEVGGRSFRLSGGDVFLAYPNERHSTGGLPEEKGVLYWMVLRVAPGRSSFLGLPHAQGAALRRALLAVRPRHFRGSWKMKEQLDAITSLYQEKSGPLNALAMGNQFAAFFVEVLACAHKQTARETSRPLRPVLRYVEQHLDEPLPASRLAVLAGLSVPRFKVRFKQETGIPPGEFVLRAKIDEAERRIRRGAASITDVAFDLGFSSSQYFATVFKRFTGHTPSDVRIKY